MIIDNLANWNLYQSGPAWKLAFDFLNGLTPEAEEKRYPLQGDDIFAIVMSYETKSPELALLETHRKYLDIQAVLVGAERFECFSKDELMVDVPYDETKDAEFYKRTFPGPVSINAQPGTFIMLFPQDAHMPGLMIDDKAERIKKVVVKINLELLR